MPTHQFWTLEILIDRRIDRPDIGRFIMQHLLTMLPEFRPIRFGDIEPRSHVWSDDLLDNIGQIWPPNVDSFAFDGRGATRGWMSSITGNHIHSKIVLRAQGSGPPDSRARAFLVATLDHLGADFGLIHSFTADEIARARANGTLHYAEHRMPFFQITSHDLTRGLPDLYWTTVLGQRYVEMFGPERVRSLTRGSVEFLASGQAVVEIMPTSAAVAQRPDAFAQARDSIIEHLGRDAFYDVSHPKAPKRAPVFDDSIARSLRRSDPLAVEARRRAGL